MCSYRPTLLASRHFKIALNNQARPTLVKSAAALSIYLYILIYYYYGTYGIKYTVNVSYTVSMRREYQVCLRVCSVSAEFTLKRGFGLWFAISPNPTLCNMHYMAQGSQFSAVTG